MGINRHTYKSYKQWLKQNKPGYTLVSEFTRAEDNHTFQHDCGRIFCVAPSKLRQQVTPCPDCRSEKSVGIRTVEDYKKDLFDRHSDEYVLVSKEYTKLNDLHEYKHMICGTTFDALPWKFTQNKVPCPVCRTVGGEGKCRTDDTYCSYLETRWNGEYSLVSDFTTLKDKHTFLHATCGNEFDAIPYAVRKTRVPCPKCRGIVIGSQYSTEEYTELLERKWGDEYVLLSDEYVDGHTQHLYKHVRCGTEFSSLPYKLRRVPIPCPDCCSNGPGVARLVRIYLGGKEFRVQGKERIALAYVWKKTRCGIEELLPSKKDMPNSGINSKEKNTGITQMSTSNRRIFWSK